MSKPITKDDVTHIPGLLTGDVAVVTGAAQGNGAAFARGLALSGARVAAADIDRGKLDAFVAELRELGGKVEAYELDVTDEAACEAFAARVEADLGPVSILVNNAGIVRRVPITEDGFVKSVEDQISVNVLGSVFMTRALARQLAATGGRVINLGSIASFRATTGGIGYGISKGAVRLMTQTMAAEMAPMGVRVNGIAPGVIVTPMTEVTRQNPESMRMYMDHIPMKRLGEADELVGPVLFLASRISSYMTGVMMPVDGGFTSV